MTHDSHLAAHLIYSLGDDTELSSRHGTACREQVQSKYTVAALVEGYLSPYDTLHKRKSKIRKLIKSCAE
jgi:hypothetical protein